MRGDAMPKGKKTKGELERIIHAEVGIVASVFLDKAHGENGWSATAIAWAGHEIRLQHKLDQALRGLRARYGLKK